MFSTFSRLALVSLAVALPSSGKIASLLTDAGLFSIIPFDYLIVGGGTAGLALATRLSEDATVTVGVIEAGLYNPDEPLINTPERFGQSIGSELDWGLLTTPQPGGDGASVLLSSGKTLGGSSALNFLAWTRASKAEYDAWETLGNGPTWNWASLLPYFKKVETYQVPPPQGIFPNATVPSPQDISDVHGTNGPVKVSFNSVYGAATFPFVKAMNALGIRTSSEPNGGNSTGVFNLPSSTDRALGERSYAANSYFNLSSNRPNLHILTSAHANKIVFANSNSKLVATGVQYTLGHQTLVASAKKEVILSAGSMQSPKLLELSGIGNKTLLEGLGIETLLDLPQVGENLQDQPLVARDFLTQPDPTGLDEQRNNLAFALAQLKQYETTNDGLYTATVPAVAFLPLLDLISGDVNATINALETKLTSELADTTITPLYAAQMKIQLEWLVSQDVPHVEVLIYDGGGMTSTPPAPNSTYLTVFTTLQHPFSRGSVHISSTDPLQPPILNPSYLGLSIDADTFGFTGPFVDNVTQTQPLAAMVISPSTPPAGSDFLTYARKSLGTIWHPIGTAALAPQDLGGVVDPNLLVYGTANVRVVDASIFPLHIATHPQATIYAIAEKAADIIRAAS